MNPGAPCPCTAGRPFAECCGRYIDAATPAPDAEALMRSRYSAFALRNAPYLLASWHPSTRPLALGLPANQKWLGLDVREHAIDPLDADRASVEFVARSRIDGRGVRLHERSRFTREDGRWFYVAGDMIASGSKREEQR